MKLILIKKSSRGNRCIDGIRIGVSSFSISGTAFDRLVKGKDVVYSSIGINDEGNVCLYVSYLKHEQLYKMYVPKNVLRSVHVSVNTKEQKAALSPYIGTYDIKFVSVDPKLGITEVVLKKN
jgi:hypothetical protein